MSILAFQHLPAKILQRVLIDLGLGSDPDVLPADVWPVLVSFEPALPDELIIVKDTTGIIDARIMGNGSYSEFFGVQVSIRSSTPAIGYIKASAIAYQLDTQIYNTTILGLGGCDYLLESVRRPGPIINVGKGPDDKRNTYTINALLTLRRTA